jgi:hypothetical protein
VCAPHTHFSFFLANYNSTTGACTVWYVLLVPYKRSFFRCDVFKKRVFCLFYVIAVFLNNALMYDDIMHMMIHNIIIIHP